MYCWASGVILPKSGISRESSLFPSDVGCFCSDFLLDIFSFSNFSSPTLESSGFCLPMFPSYISMFFSRQSLYSAFRSVYLQYYNGLHFMLHVTTSIELNEQQKQFKLLLLEFCKNSSFLPSHAVPFFFSFLICITKKERRNIVFEVTKKLMQFKSNTTVSIECFRYYIVYPFQRY